MADDHSPGHLQAGVEVEQQPQRDQRQPLRGRGEEQQRNRRHRPGKQQQRRVARPVVDEVGPVPRTSSQIMKPTANGSATQRLDGDADPRIGVDHLLDQPVEAERHGKHEGDVGHLAHLRGQHRDRDDRE